MFGIPNSLTTQLILIAIVTLLFMLSAQTGLHRGIKYLIERRAAAVAKSLETEFKISSSRLKSAGVGYLAPAGSNGSEAGRALNRWVALVEDK